MLYQNRRIESAFTLIELLVVISIIALLMAIMMPGLSKARAIAKGTVCKANQKNISMVMSMYAFQEHYFHPAQNGEKWYDLGTGSGNTGKMLKPDDSSAYWGIIYSQYGLEDKHFSCPAKRVYIGRDRVLKPEHEKGFIYSDYGLNCYLIWEGDISRTEDPTTANRFYSPGKGNRRFEKFARPTETIMFHDAYEGMLDDNGDMFHIHPNPQFGGQIKRVNLAQWRWNEVMQKRHADAVREYWRHNDAANIAWLDGHVSTQKKTMGEDFKRTWYTGLQPGTAKNN